MASIEDIIKKAKPREVPVRVVLAGDLAAQVESLEAQLQAMSASGWERDSLGAKDPRREVAEQIAALREQMAASEVEFRFRAIGDDKAWSDLLAAHPPRKDTPELFNAETLPRELIAACAVEPKMTADQYDRLAKKLNQAQRNKLFQAAWDANTEETAVPFSLSASAILAAHTDEK